jgi:hypothetical protein
MTSASSFVFTANSTNRIRIRRDLKTRVHCKTLANDACTRGGKTFHPVTGKTRNRRLDEKGARESKPSIEFGAICDVISTGN